MAMVLRQGITMPGRGLVAGLAASFWLTRRLKSLRFEITPSDTAKFAVVACVMGLVAVTACSVPARRAMNVDPLVALRWE